MRSLLWIVILSTVFSCLPESDAKQPKKKATKKDGIKRSYYSDGKLRAEVPIKNGKKNGVAKDFYPNGKPHLEISYVDSKKDGITKKYYEDGSIFEETPYKSDEIHGVQKRYRPDGKLSSEARYHNGQPCLGLKEFLKDGSPRKNYPSIVITPIDNTLKNDQYILRLTMSDKSKDVVFYQGEMEGGCVSYDLDNIYATTTPGVSEIKYDVPPGMFFMKEINFIAKVKTVQGNYYVTQRKYNLAVENR